MLMNMKIKTLVFCALFLNVALFAENPVPSRTFGVKVFAENSNQYVQVAQSLKTALEQPSIPNDPLQFQLIEKGSQPELFQYYVEILEDKELLRHRIPRDTPTDTESSEPLRIGRVTFKNSDEPSGPILELEYLSYFTCKIIDVKTGAFLGSFGYQHTLKDTIRDADLAKENLAKYQGVIALKTLADKYLRKNESQLPKLAADWPKIVSDALSKQVKKKCFDLFFPYYRVELMVESKKDKAQVLKIHTALPPFQEQYAILDIYRMTKIGDLEVPELLANGQYRRELAEKEQLFVFNNKKEVYEAAQNGDQMFAVFKDDAKLNTFADFMPGKAVNAAIQFDYSELQLSPFNRRALENNFEELALYSGKKLNIVNRSSQYQIDRLRELFKAEKYLDDVNFDDRDRLIGADYLITFKPGVVDSEVKTSGSIFTAVNSNADPSEYIPIDVKVTEVKTGEVIAQQSGRVNITKKRGEAFHTLGSYFLLNDLMEEAFDVNMKIVDMLEVKKDKADEVLVVSPSGLVAYQKYQVFRIDEEVVNGESLERPVEIGKITIQETYSTFTGRANVNDGEKEIYEAMSQGKKLICSRKPGLINKVLNLGSKE